MGCASSKQTAVGQAPAQVPSKAPDAATSAQQAASAPAPASSATQVTSAPAIPLQVSTAAGTASNVEVGTSVNTAYGRGRVSAVRADQVVVALAFGTAFLAKDGVTVAADTEEAGATAAVQPAAAEVVKVEAPADVTVSNAVLTVAPEGDELPQVAVETAPAPNDEQPQVAVESSPTHGAAPEEHVASVGAAVKTPFGQGVIKELRGQQTVVSLEFGATAYLDSAIVAANGNAANAASDPAPVATTPHAQ